MSAICPGCHGVVGRDCFNPVECEWIMRDMEAHAAAERIMYEMQAADYAREQQDDYERTMAADFDADRLDAVGLGLA